jgi:hypothetical protein
METTTGTVTGGLSFTSVLFFVFLVLKLCGIIDWSWWWITAPLWGGLALILAGYLIFLIVVGILALFKPWY